MVDGEYKLYNIHSIIISPATLQIMLLQRPLLMLLCLHHHHCNFFFEADSKKFIRISVKAAETKVSRKEFINDTNLQTQISAAFYSRSYNFVHSITDQCLGP